MLRLGGVILSAGYSSRMGDFKPLMRLGERSLLGHCITLFKRTGIKKIVVVTGHRAEETAKEARRYDVEPVYNPDYDSGMFSSVCVVLPHLQGLDGFFMLPVDIPTIRPLTVELLKENFDGSRILFPTRGGEKGHPPLIPTSIIPRILADDGTEGLQRVLLESPGSEVAIWDDGAFMDTDTAEDFARAKGRFDRLAVGSRKEAEVLAELSMVPKGVVHGRAVAEVADHLREELAKAGCKIDADKVHNGALLHDIGKGVPDHEAEGARMMQRLGLSELAEVVGAHRDAKILDNGHFGEKELVCLADKLVHGGKRVVVEERFAEKLEIYKADEQACRAIRRRLDNALGLQRKVEEITGKTLEEMLPQP